MKLLRQLAAAAAASVAFCAHAQTAIQPGSIVGTFSVAGWTDSSTLFTVPGDRSARVTDIVLTNYNAYACSTYLVLGSSTLYLNAPPGTSILSFNSGWGLVAGAGVYGTYGLSPTCNAVSTSSQVWATLRGYYFVVP